MKLLTCIIFFILSLLSFMQHAHGMDQSIFDRTEYQLGPLSEGRTEQFQIPLKNNTGRHLQILSIESTCVYVDAAVDRKNLGPDETALATIRVDTEGNLGKIAKTIEIRTSVFPEPHVLTIRGTILHRAFDRSRPQAMFHGACTTCHVGKKIASYSGQALYDAVCYLCHKETLLNSTRDDSILRHVIISGIPGTLMPGFAEASGGPLTLSQMDSLVHLLKKNQQIKNQ